MQFDEWINKVSDSVIQPQKVVVMFTDCDDVDTVEQQQTSVQGVYSDIKGSYIGIYYPWLDLTSDSSDIHVPQSYYVLQKQYKQDLWKPMQGVNYGGISDQRIFNKKLTDSHQDYLSDRNINAIRYFPTYNPSVIIFEEKTHYDRLSQLQRISQRRTQISIEMAVSQRMRYFLFEPLVESTFQGIIGATNNIMEEFVSKAQIYEYKTSLDTSLHLLDNNMVLLTVYFKPMKYLEFVDLYFYVRSYQAGVGQEYTGQEVR